MHLLQSGVDYQAIPAKVSQQVLILLDKNWQSFFQAIRAYNERPSKFKSRPKLPKYKHKKKGRNILVYNMRRRLVNLNQLKTRRYYYQKVSYFLTVK